MSYENFRFHSDQRAMGRGQRRRDNMMPEEESPMRRCVRCKKEYNSDSQELDSHGKDWCDECVQKHEDEQGPQT